MRAIDQAKLNAIYFPLKGNETGRLFHCGTQMSPIQAKIGLNGPPESVYGPRRA